MTTKSFENHALKNQKGKKHLPQESFSRKPKNKKKTSAFAFTHVSKLLVEGELKKMKQAKSIGIDDLPTGR